MQQDHRYGVRFAHGLAAVAVPVMALSGLEIFRAFPSFGAKLPPSLMVPVPAEPGLGGWLGGALGWHFTFGWIFAAAGLLWLLDLLRGGWRRFHPHHALYNPQQKGAYVVVMLGAVTLLATGILLAQPAQWGWWIDRLGGWQFIRFAHFAAMLGFLAFIPGHVVMVMRAGRRVFLSMVTGEAATAAPAPHPAATASAPNPSDSRPTHPSRVSRDDRESPTPPGS